MINICNLNLPKQALDSLNVINLTHFEVQITTRHSTSENTYMSLWSRLGQLQYFWSGVPAPLCLVMTSAMMS